MINKDNHEGRVRRVNSTSCEDTHLVYYKLHTTNLRTLKKGTSATAITYELILCIHHAKTFLIQRRTGKHQKAEPDQDPYLQYNSSFTA